MGLYQKEKINPFGGCLPLLLQLPILIALYRVFWKGLQPEEIAHLYSFVPPPGAIDPTFLGVVNLAEASIGVAILAGICQFFQSKMITPKTKKARQKEGMAQFSGMMQKQMLYFFPIFTVFILWRLPAAIGFYWMITALFSIGQQYLIFKRPSKGSPPAPTGEKGYAQPKQS
jgi:YidC/Oxa1 family membrane protein insertase